MTEITEIVEFDATRVDAVKEAANGFPILLMKAVNSQGGIDEGPDIDGSAKVLQALAKLIVNEAQEMATGHFDEVCDIDLLCEAAHLMRCFRQKEIDTAADDGEPILKGLEECATWLIKRNVSADERKRLAREGKALEDGSYPIANAEDLKNAAHLANSGHGNVAAAKRLIAKRARELGVPNPLSKETMAEEDTKETETSVSPEEETVSKETSPEAPEESPDISELVKSAVAEAIQASEKRVEALESELAKVLATPLPGGPAMTAPAHMRNEMSKSQRAADAKRFERLAEEVRDPDLRRFYLEKSKELNAN